MVKRNKERTHPIQQQTDNPTSKIKRLKSV